VAGEYRRHKIIILIGPDGSGKSTLAKKLDLTYYHSDMNSKYGDYLNPLVSLEMYNAVCDRFIFCEIPYSSSLNRKFQYSMKEFHNIVLLTLIQKPVIVLFTHKPSPTEYSEEQYLPYDKWDNVLSGYRKFLNTHHIPFIEFDYAKSPITVEALLLLEKRYSNSMKWWVPMWKNGWGAIGSPHPKILLVGERQGPNNLQNIPFQTGPTGQMLTTMLDATKTPLWDFAVTNMVKSYRRDSRPPNSEDLELLGEELDNLRPKIVVFMGAVAKYGIKAATSRGIPYHTVTHFGYYNYRRDKSVGVLHEQWKKIISEG